MNTLVKITTLLLFLITSGCVHHVPHYSDEYTHGVGYDYSGGGYNSYSSYPVYYEQDVYVLPPAYDHRYDSHKRHYTYPNKHAKPNNRYNNYQAPNKHRKTNLTNQYRNKPNRYNSEKFIPKNNASHRQHNSSNKQYNKFQKPKVNKGQGYSPSYNKREKPRNTNYSTNQQPASSFGSKHRKSNNNFSSAPQRRQYSDKRTKK